MQTTTHGAHGAQPAHVEQTQASPPLKQQRSKAVAHVAHTQTSRTSPKPSLTSHSLTPLSVRPTSNKPGNDTTRDQHWHTHPPLKRGPQVELISLPCSRCWAHTQSMAAGNAAVVGMLCSMLHTVGQPSWTAHTTGDFAGPSPHTRVLTGPRQKSHTLELNQTQSHTPTQSTHAQAGKRNTTSSAKHLSTLKSKQTL